MKKLLFYIVLFLSYHSISGQTNIPDTEVDTCSPNFKEVYDFQVGDVFQYVNNSWSSAGGTGYNYKTTTKYTIRSKSELADTLTYSIDGVVRDEFYCDIGPWPGCEYKSSFKLYQNILRHVDSTDHFLNKCNNELVSFDFYGDKYSRIKIEIQNSIRVKRIGGQDNFFEYNEKDSLIAIEHENIVKVYAKNLGEIANSSSVFESSDTRYLQGYIKNGDTTGTISLDEDLMVSAIDTRELEDIIAYPNPTTGILYFPNAETSSNSNRVEIFDVKGNKIADRNIRETTLDLNDLTEGIYFIKIISDKNIVIKKVILE